MRHVSDGEGEAKRTLREVFTALGPRRASCSSAASSSPARGVSAVRSRASAAASGYRASRARSTRDAPTHGWPASTATVAGTAPAARTAASTSRAVARFAGKGMPCEMIVDSRATTGRCAANADATSGERRTNGAACARCRKRRVNASHGGGCGSREARRACAVVLLR
jgi:hypothetical protein